MNEPRWSSVSSPMRRRIWDVFISHSKHDTKIALDLAEALARRGLNATSSTEAKLGDALHGIDEVVNSSGVVIVLVSEFSGSSKWATQEVDTVLESLPPTRVVPVAVGKLDVQNLPGWLANRNYLHLSESSDVPKLVKQLLPQLRAVLGDYSSESTYARVIGDLPPRVPVVGVETYLRELLTTRIGCTWIVGAAGAGKTALAREYIHHVRDRVSFVFWLSARSSGLEALDKQVREVLEVLAVADQDPGVIVVDGLDEMNERSRTAVRGLIEAGGTSRVIVTTRKIADVRRPLLDSILTVGPLSRQSVDDYISLHLPDLDPDRRSELRSMLDTAGESPVVLTMLIRAFEQNSFGAALSSASNPEMALDRSIAVSLASLTQHQRQRIDVLAQCSELLPVIQRDSRWRLPEDHELFRQLTRLGLMNATSEGNVFAHPAVVDILRQNAPRRALEDTVTYVAKRLPDIDDADSPELLPGIAALTKRAGPKGGPQFAENMAELLIWEASVWRLSGDYPRAELLSPQALEHAKNSRDDLLFIRAMNLQSAIAFDRGHLDEASHIERQTIDVASRVFGPAHPITTASLANLALTLSALGELSEAITLLQTVVERNAEMLPTSHPDAVASQISLAFCLREAGQYQSALAHLQTALANDVNPAQSLRISRILAATLADLGQSAEALDTLHQSLERALSGKDPLMGPHSMDVLTTRASLAMLVAQSGDPVGALEVQTDVLQSFEVLLGHDHPSTLNARSNQAILMSRSGDSQRALAMLLAVVADRSKVIGPDHPDTLRSRLLAARALADAQQGQEALRVYESLVGDMVRTLGPQHGMTFTVREEFAQQLKSDGRGSESRLTYRELLADLEHALPMHHPMVERVRSTVSRLN